MKKPLLISLFAFLFCAAAWFYFLYRPVIYQKEGITYFLRPGTSNKVFIADLQARGLINYTPLFWLYILPQKNAQIKTGEYLFPQGSNLISIWSQVINGTGLVNHAFTIVPGWTFHQLRQELKKRDNLRHLSAKLSDEEIMLRLGGKGLPEGQFFPETYHYSRGIQDLVILKRAFDLMQSRLKEAWANKADNLPYKNEYEALIAASMIEKESGTEDERPIIASVLVNRLKKEMLLQFDPTVIYGLGDKYDGKIHKANLVDTNPFNTYIHKGLPPTPIAMPSISAINAALHPKPTNYFYFVAKGDGSHQFSESLRAHQDAVVAAANNKSNYWFNDVIVSHYLKLKLLKNLKQFALQQHGLQHVQ